MSKTKSTAAKAQAAPKTPAPAPVTAPAAPAAEPVVAVAAAPEVAPAPVAASTVEAVVAVETAPEVVATPAPAPAPFVSDEAVEFKAKIAESFCALVKSKTQAGLPRPDAEKVAAGQLTYDFGGAPDEIKALVSAGIVEGKAALAAERKPAAGA